MPIINLQFINCDTHIKESVIPNPDGSYTIFLNARLSTQQLQESYRHALGHIVNDDFFRADADTIEALAHSFS